MATKNSLQDNSSTTTDRIVAYFDDREKAYQAMSRLKDSGLEPDHIGLAVGQDYEASSTSGLETRNAAGTQDTSFWQKVKDFFSGEDHDDQTDFRDATGDMGWDDQRAGYYRQGISAGGAIVTVTGERTQEARKILQEYGGDLRETGFETNNVIPGSEPGRRETTTGTNRLDAEGQHRIQLRGEILRTYKERVQRGEVRLRKEVVTENQSVNVPVTREELVIERAPATATSQATGPIGTDQEIRIPLSEERVRVEKQPVVNEEVRVGKRQVQSNKQVSDQVRHEELRVDKSGDLDTEADQNNPKSEKPAA